MPSDHIDRIRDQFTRQAQAYADTAQAKDDAAHASLAALVGLRSTDRVLDVACGPGYLTRAFAARCAEAVGIDATDALLDIARRNGGRVMVADLVTSPNPQFARAHKAIERLCDPTHVRALPSDELRALFVDKDIEIVEDRPGRMHYGLTQWLAHGGPPADAEQEIRRRFAAALENDGTALAVRRDGDETYFTHQTLVLVGRR
jgi:SAM-dependent methyltransferase